MSDEAVQLAFATDAEKAVVMINRTAAAVGTVERFLKGLAKTAHRTSVEHGFWEEPEMMDKYAAKLALVHSEVTEVLEALRKRQGKDKVTEEFADIFIRCFCLHEKLVEDGEATDDLQDTILRKMKDNDARPVKHGHRWG